MDDPSPSSPTVRSEEEIEIEMSTEYWLSLLEDGAQTSKS